MKLKRIVSALLATAFTAVLALPVFGAGTINEHEKKILDALDTEINGVRVLETVTGRDFYNEVEYVLMWDEVDLTAAEADAVVANIYVGKTQVEAAGYTTIDELIDDVNLYNSIADLITSTGELVGISLVEDENGEVWYQYDSSKSVIRGPGGSASVGGGSSSGDPSKPTPGGKPVYTVLDNERGTYSGSGTYAVRIDADPETLVGVFYGDKELEEGKDYTVSEGSTIITFSEAFLSTLAKGTHTFVIEFEDGVATATIIITADGSNAGSSTGSGDSKKDAIVQTGDEATSLPYVILAFVALAGCGTAVVLRKKVRG